MVSENEMNFVNVNDPATYQKGVSNNQKLALSNSAVTPKYYLPCLNMPTKPI